MKKQLKPGRNLHLSVSRSYTSLVNKDVVPVSQWKSLQRKPLTVYMAIATALPVLSVAWILAYSVQNISTFYGKIQTIQKWLNQIVGILFLIVGIYYCYIMYL